MLKRVFSLIFVILFTALTVVYMQNHNYWWALFTSIIVGLHSVVVLAYDVKLEFEVTTQNYNDQNE